MESLNRDAPIGVRFRPDERELVEHAARISRQRLSDFVRETTLDVARAIVVRPNAS